MPLVISDRPIHLPSSSRDFIDRYSQLKEGAKSLKSKPVRRIGPKGLLYVQQREFAATTPQDDSVSILGTGDATTCHLVVLRHTGSGATSLAHCDGSDTEETVPLMLNAVKSLSVGCDSGRYEVHLIGGFIDERSLSHKLTLELLEAFNRQSENIHLETYCLTELNDVVKKNVHWPVIYGIAVNVKTGEIFHATFPDRGPDEVIRSARNFLGGSIMSVYDAKVEQLQIESYQWTLFPAAQFWLQQTDQVILQNFSTSPLVEPPHFVKHMRSIFQFLIRYPEESLFPKGRSRIYKKTADGLWERIDCAA
ncbi:protein N-terminal asparagine amidohydrolase isoform X1 [Carcharodon carcharias]|uniref:protein N-terminal asparagine amidohydrolase isoform X1 n=1 Tax=Carcharodon carcharias TaxID=13397 RepID=UPI001B7DC365|nr:protein N-terminal asparagine amidohydrolase isoform X1 [Carcharodon carcharias]